MEVNRNLRLNIKVEMGPEINTIGTQLPGPGYGQGRPDAVLPCLIRGDAHNTLPNASFWIGSDYYGLSFQLRMLSDIYGGKEGIQIDVQDYSHSGSLFRDAVEGILHLRWMWLETMKEMAAMEQAMRMGQDVADIAEGR